MNNQKNNTSDPLSPANKEEETILIKEGDLPPEFGGRKGPEPTRYGDWENNGITSDF